MSEMEPMALIGIGCDRSLAWTWGIIERSLIGRVVPTCEEIGSKRLNWCCWLISLVSAILMALSMEEDCLPCLVRPWSEYQDYYYPCLYCCSLRHHRYLCYRHNGNPNLSNWVCRHHLDHLTIQLDHLRLLCLIYCHHPQVFHAFRKII